MFRTPRRWFMQAGAASGECQASPEIFDCTPAARQIPDPNVSLRHHLHNPSSTPLHTSPHALELHPSFSTIIKLPSSLEDVNSKANDLHPFYLHPRLSTRPLSFRDPNPSSAPTDRFTEPGLRSLFCLDARARTCSDFSFHFARRQRCILRQRKTCAGPRELGGFGSALRTLNGCYSESCRAGTPSTCIYPRRSLPTLSPNSSWICHSEHMLVDLSMQT